MQKQLLTKRSMTIRSHSLVQEGGFNFKFQLHCLFIRTHTLARQTTDILGSKVLGHRSQDQVVEPLFRDRLAAADDYFSFYRFDPFFYWDTRLLLFHSSL
jgi:hypothetical protein